MLGTLEVVDPRTGPVKIAGVKTRAVLAMLLISRNRLVSADRIAEQLWHGSPPPSAAGTVQAYVSRLRRALAVAPTARAAAAGAAGASGGSQDGTPSAGPLITRKPGYLLAVSDGEVDADRFERLLGVAATTDDPATAASALRQGLALWRGPAVAEFASYGFAQPEATRLEELRLVAVERRCAADLALGRHLDLIAELEQLVGAYPLRERLTGLWMTALYRAGRQSDALRAYQAAYRRLAEEIGVVPGPDLRALEAAILAHDAQLLLPVPAEGAVPPALPAALARLAASSPLMGRRPELNALQSAWTAADEHGCRLVVVSGEAGIGKSRLVADFARTIHDAGAPVLFGRALDRQLVPYQPLVEAFGDHLAAGAPGQRARLLAAAGPPLGWLLPSLAATTASAAHPELPEPELPISELPEPDLSEPDLSEPDMLEPDLSEPDLSEPDLSEPDLSEPDLSEPERAGPGAPAARRYLMFEAAAALLAGLRTPAGVLVVIEDLHLADRSTLSLLEHLVRRARPGRILIVASVDDALELTNEPLRELMTGSGCDGRLDRIPLAGLTRDAVGALLGSVSPAVADAVWQRTRGNPLFVAELADHPDGEPIPARIRDLILVRLGRLEPGLTDVLRAAAVAGSEFEAGVVATMLGRPLDLLEPLFDRAVNARLVEEVTAVPRRLRFAHRVVFEALGGTLSAAQESTLRRRLIGALAAAENCEDYLGVLAHHFRLTAREDARHAVDYSRRAGDRASTLLGFAEAAQQYQHALETLDWLPGDTRRERGELLLRLGVARRATYQRQATADAFLAAAELALALPDPGMLARAAWGLVTVTEFSVASLDAARVLRQGLASVATGDSPLAVALSAGLARAVPGDPDATPLARAAIAMARRLGDPESVLLAVGAGVLVTWAPDNRQERVAGADEVIVGAPASGWMELAMEARAWRAACAEELGDFPAADADLAAVGRWAEASGQPFFRALGKLRGAARALFEGRYTDADRLSRAAVDGVDAGPDFYSGFAAQQFGLLRDLGRLDEIDALLSALVDNAPRVPAWRAARAVADVELGRPDRARAELDRLLAAGFGTLPPDWLWLSAVGHLADVCVDVGHRPAAEALYPLLLPYAEHNIVLAHGVQCTGSAARQLGGLAALLGRWPDAADHFAAAIAANRGWSAAPWLARAQLDYAAASLAHGDGPALASGLLTEAAEIVEAHGIAGLAGRVAALRARLGDRAESASGQGRR